MIHFSVCQIQEALKKALLEVMADFPSLSATITKLPKIGTSKIPNSYCAQNVSTLRIKSVLPNELQQIQSIQNL